MRSAAQIQAEALAIAPDGWALPKDPSSYFAAWFAGLANELARVEDTMESMLPQVDPRAAPDLLSGYQRVLGPDPCGRDLLALSFADQAALAFQRWTQNGNICAGFFETQAAALGESLIVTEYTVSMAGLSVAGGTMLVNNGQEFGFTVSLPATRVTRAVANGTQAGDLLGSFTPNLMECVVRLYAPLHTTPYFSYLGDDNQLLLAFGDALMLGAANPLLLN